MGQSALPRRAVRRCIDHRTDPYRDHVSLERSVARLEAIKVDITRKAGHLARRAHSPKSRTSGWLALRSPLMDKRPKLRQCKTHRCKCLLRVLGIDPHLSAVELAGGDQAQRLVAVQVPVVRAPRWCAALPALLMCVLPRS